MMREVFDPWLDRTNIFQYLGVHYVDLIYFLTGARPIRALATGQPHAPGSPARHGADAIQALIEWQHPAIGQRFASTIVANWVDPDTTSAMSDQKITVVGTEGRYQIDQKNRGAQLVTQEGGISEVNPYFTQIYVDGGGNPGVHGYGPGCITQFLRDVADVAAGRRRRQDLVGQRPTFLDCLPSTAVIDVVNQSLAAGGQWIDVPETPADAAGLAGAGTTA